MESKCGFILLITLTYFAFNLVFIKANEVSFIKKCKAEDSKCIKKSAQVAIPILAAGIPSLGVDSVDPMIFDKINVTEYPNMKLFLDNVVITGLKDCVAANIKRNLKKSSLLIQLLCSLELNGHYDVSGHILTAPIEGKGKFKIIFTTCHIDADANIENIKKDGKTYWHIKDTSHKFILPEKATVEIQGLFDGNEELARAARDVIDTFTNELILEFGKPVIDMLTDKVMNTVEQFYAAVPAENLALD